MHEKHEQFPLINHQLKEKMKQFGHVLQVHRFSPAEKILQQGDISSQIYIIISGEARVYLDRDIEVELARLKEGQFFGEMSCLTNDPISANVDASTELEVVSVSRSGLLLLMDENAQFRMQIIETMIKRIQNSNLRVEEEHAKSMLLMKEQEQQEQYGAMIGESAAMKQLAMQIERSAAGSNHIVIVGEAGTGRMHAARSIHQLATNGKYPFMTLSASQFGREEWKAKLKAAKGGTLAIMNSEQLEDFCKNEIVKENKETRIIMLSMRTLGLLGWDCIQVPSLRERAEDIPVLAQHFAMCEGAIEQDRALSQDALRMLSLFPYLTNNVGELQRIVKEAYVRSEGRTITSGHLRFDRHKKAGERLKIGLALGSGSLRGMAHIGVLRVLEQEGIVIDYIAGTSVGSLVGGAYAAGMSSSDLEHVVTTMGWRRLVRPTFPKQSFVHNTPMIQFIESHLGVRNIEELPIPFAAIASDTLTGEAFIMNQGSLAKAISASSAIPAVMRPVNFQGKTLIDGAVIHPVPAALVKSMGADIVIAVNVSSEAYTRGKASNFITSLMNTIDMMSAKIVREELQLADIVLRPDLGQQAIGFKDMRRCIAAGEEAARGALKKLHQLMQSN